MKNLIISGVIIMFMVAGLFYFRSRNEESSQALQERLNAPAQQTQTTEKDIPRVTILAENLDTPWGIAILPDKSMLVTERKGTVQLINAKGKLAPTPVTTIQKVKEVGEGGLLGIAIHPDFATNGFVYFYYTYSSTGDNTFNRVVRMKYFDTTLSAEQVIVDAIPGASNHNGGRIKFGPDNNLYITTGDAQEPSQSQDKNTLGGKILRVTDDGKPAPGNPFKNRVYSYGHRNPQGIAWDENGMLWQTEHGRSFPSGLDEINLIKPGNNYGWPTIEGDESAQGMLAPKKQSGASVTWAPGGTAIIGNSLFFSGLRGQALYEAQIENGNIGDVKEHFTSEFGRIRDVIAGPDGVLYITTSNQDGRGLPGDTDDRIIRINPSAL